MATQAAETWPLSLSNRKEPFIAKRAYRIVQAAGCGGRVSVISAGPPACSLHDVERMQSIPASLFSIRRRRYEKTTAFHCGLALGIHCFRVGAVSRAGCATGIRGKGAGGFRRHHHVAETGGAKKCEPRGGRKGEADISCQEQEARQKAHAKKSIRGCELQGPESPVQADFAAMTRGVPLSAPRPHPPGRST